MVKREKTDVLQVPGLILGLDTFLTQWRVCYRFELSSAQQGQRVL